MNDARFDVIREALTACRHARTFGAVIEHDALCASTHGLGDGECNCTVAAIDAALHALDSLAASEAARPEECPDCGLPVSEWAAAVSVPDEENTT